MAIIENINVSTPNDGLGDSLRNSQIKANNNFAELNNQKVEKIAGKDLSKNDFTDLLKAKLDGIEAGAQVNVPPLWSEIIGAPELSEFFSAVGGFDYEDLATQTVPLTYTSGFLQLTNDKLGANTQTNLGPYGVTDVWDEVNSTFQFGQLSIGDEVILRVHLNITTTTANQISGLSLLFAEGLPTEYLLPIDLQIYHKTAGAHDLIKEISFYIGNEDWRTEPVKIRFNSDANSSIKVHGFHPFIIRKSINILDVNDDNYKTFSILNIEPNNNDTSVSNGGVSIGYNSLNNKIDSILFDAPFSQKIYNYDLLKLIYDFSLNFIDKSNGKSYASFITNFTQVGAHYKLELEETLLYTDFNLNDKIEVFINATKKSSGGVTDHTLLTNIGTNTHAQIDAHLVNTSNPHGVTKGQVGLANVVNLDTSTTANITDSLNKRFVSDSDLTDLSNLSGTNTGDESLTSLQTKRPLKTVDGQSVEGSGNLPITKTLDNVLTAGNTSNLELVLRGLFLGASTGSNLYFSNSSVRLNGNNNILFGKDTGISNLTGSGNLFFGNGAGASNGSGSNNSVFGYLALNVHTNGSQCVAMGASALRVLTSGSNNISIGYFSSDLLVNGSNNLAIGSNVSTPNGQSNRINIMNFLYKDSSGNFGIDIDTPTAKLDVNGSTRLRGSLLDFNNETGTAGQVLSSTGTGVDWTDASAVGVTDHTLLTNIGTNTHAQIDAHILANTGDETLTSLQTKRPLKTINSQSLEGVGNLTIGGGGGLIVLTANVNLDFGTETDGVVLTIPETGITNANVKGVSFMPVETAETSLDDFKLNGVSFNLENIIDNVSFDLRATATNNATGIYTIKYIIQI